MAALTNYLENALADFLLRGQTFTAPTTVYIGLCTSATSDAAIGTEVSGGSYARVAVSCSLGEWVPTQGAESPQGVSSGTGGQISNANAINFPTPTAGWGEVTHWFIGDSDGSPTGNILFHGALTVAKTINTSDTVSFAAGSLTITFS